MNRQEDTDTCMYTCVEFTFMMLLSSLSVLLCMCVHECAHTTLLHLVNVTQQVTAKTKKTHFLQLHVTETVL